MTRKEIKGPINDEMLNNQNHNFKELYNEYRNAGLDATDARKKADESLKKSNSALNIAKQSDGKSNVTQQQLDDIILDDGTGNAEVIQARGDYPLLKDRLNETTKQLADYPLLKDRLNETTKQLAENNPSIPLTKTSSSKLTDESLGAIVLTYKDGYVWGRSEGKIKRSNDNGETWEIVSNQPLSSIHSILWTDDDEVIMANRYQVVKSKGWKANPQTATWDKKLETSDLNGQGILAWGIDGDGEKFIVTEYSGRNRSESRYIWISTDKGNTFNVVFDKHDKDPNQTSHMHGVCYDKWADRFFVSHGHGDIVGVYYSDDDGLTWEKVGGELQPNPAPTVLTATDNGIVCGSDSGYAGLYGIKRTENPKDMIMEYTSRWPTPRSGVSGFAYKGIRDNDTGHVYISFKSDHDDVNPVIMAGTATTGNVITEFEKGKSDFIYFVVSDDKLLGVVSYKEGNKHFNLDKPQKGVDTLDKGNINTGTSQNNTSIAVGVGVDIESSDNIVVGNKAYITGVGSNYTQNVVLGNRASSRYQSVVLGYESSSSKPRSVVIGNRSKTTESNGISIGSDSINEGQNSVIIGVDAKTASPGVVSIGQGSEVNGIYGTSVGKSSKTGPYGIAIGGFSESSENRVAIGYKAKATDYNSIALGRESVTTFANQVNLGDRHIELKQTPDVGITNDGSARIYLREKDGYLELCLMIGKTLKILERTDNY